MTGNFTGIKAAKMEQNTKLPLPDNFCQACQFFSVEPPEVLEFFIGKCTLYANLVRSTSKENALAADIFDDCLISRGAVDGKWNEYSRIVCVEYVKKLMILAMSKSSPEDRRDAYIDLVTEWYASLEASLPFKRIVTTNGLTVPPTMDFCLVCEIFRLTPLELLQYYVNHVSLLAYAVKPSEESIEVMATDFFLHFPAILMPKESN